MNNNYQKSNDMLKRACQVTPLGAQTYSKSYRYFCEGQAPAFLERGEGCYVWDVDGNRFIDFICGLGPVTIGYNDPRVNAAVIKQLEKGISFSKPVAASVELAERLVEIIPCAEMVRFVKNGSDATSAAIRLARAFTGREIVIVCGYHGMQDWYIASTTNNKGIPEGVKACTKTFAYNDLASLQQVFAEHSGQVAAVIMEPIQGDGPQEGFLQAVKQEAHANGALLIFDEVVSGFRYALGGASELYNVTPDLAAFGKGMGNGLALSAVAGKKEVMELIGKEGVFVSTTFGGEALALAGTLAALEVLSQPGTYEHFWKLGGQMLLGLKETISRHGIADVMTVSGLAPHCGVAFEGKGALDYLDINSIYSQNMVEHGVLTVGINNICLAHTEREIEVFLQGAEAAAQDIVKALAQNSTAGILKGGKIDPIFKRNIR